jgi:hypothetical protein
MVAHMISCGRVICWSLRVLTKFSSVLLVEGVMLYKSLCFVHTASCKKSKSIFYALGTFQLYSFAYNMVLYLYFWVLLLGTSFGYFFWIRIFLSTNILYVRGSRKPLINSHTSMDAQRIQYRVKSY